MFNTINIEFELDGSASVDDWAAGNDLRQNLKGDWELVRINGTQYLGKVEE